MTQGAMKADGPAALALFAGVLVIGSLIAFWPSYFSKFASVADARLHAHVLFVSLWMSALIVQPLLIRARNFALHRLIGKLSFALAPLVVISAMLLSHARFAALPEEEFERLARFFYLPVQAVIGFGVAYAGAIAFRRRRPVHEAFMLGTALSLLDPIFARLLIFYAHLADDHWLYDYIGFGAAMAIAAGLMFLARDRAAKLAYGALFALYALIQVGWLTISRTEAWRDFAAWYVSLPLS